MATSCRHFVAGTANRSRDDFAFENIPWVVFDAVPLQDREELVFERFLAMVFRLIRDVFGDGRSL